MLINELAARSARLYGDLPALADGEHRFSYRELDERVTRLAAALQGLGLKHNDHVAILALNSFRYMEIYLGMPLAGMVLAPINTRLSPAETSFILKDGDIKALIIGKAFLPLFEEIKGELPEIRHLIVIDDEGRGEMHGYETLLEAADPAALLKRDWREEEMVYLCYTGGTTGLPKGVMLSQKNVISNALHTIQYAQLSERDVWLHACPMFHSADTWACVAFVALGSFHVFMERFEPRRALELIQQYKVTGTLWVPTMINMVLSMSDLDSFDFSSLRRIIFGASPMPVERLKAAIAIFGPVFQHVYGQTETSPFLTITQMRDVRTEGSEKELRRLASCGQEMLGVEVKVVDDAGREVRPGEVGEIIARGPNVMLGYWKRPEETRRALVDGWIHTGDMATVDEGNFIYIVDRAKDMIITGGENVYSTEVEDMLYRHPAVQEAAVIGVPDDQWGELVKAVVVLRPGHQAGEEELIAHCHKDIAGFKCPKSIDFSQALPKSGAGKILKSELRKPYWGGKDKAVN